MIRVCWVFPFVTKFYCCVWLAWIPWGVPWRGCGGCAYGVWFVVMALDPNLDTDGARLRRGFGEAVEKGRREKGWSRGRLATEACVSESTVIAAEGGRGGLNVYARLLRTVGVVVSAELVTTTVHTTETGSWEGPG